MSPRHGILISDERDPRQRGAQNRRSQDFERGGVNACRNSMLATKSYRSQPKGAASPSCSPRLRSSRSPCRPRPPLPQDVPGEWARPVLCKQLQGMFCTKTARAAQAVKRPNVKGIPARPSQSSAPARASKPATKPLHHGAPRTLLPCKPGRPLLLQSSSASHTTSHCCCRGDASGSEPLCAAFDSGFCWRSSGAQAAEVRDTDAGWSRFNPVSRFCPIASFSDVVWRGVLLFR